MTTPNHLSDASASCPKCQGVLKLDEYQGEAYAQCIQCGYLRFLEKEATREPQLAGHGRGRHAASRR